VLHLSDSIDELSEELHKLKNFVDELKSKHEEQINHLNSELDQSKENSFAEKHSSEGKGILTPRNRY
jgi:predicted  nucleic acid-binding Zn-ribbon protein